jgi:hypothetical protein
MKRAVKRQVRRHELGIPRELIAVNVCSTRSFPGRT